MYCVIQEIDLKKENQYGEYKELEAYASEWSAGSVISRTYYYRYTGDRFKRPIKKAYKISIHKSYREKGKVKKKQWVICTMDYYGIVSSCGSWIGDYCNLDKKCEAIGITEEELCKIVYEKLDPLVERIEKEYMETEEYKTHKKHVDIINKHGQNKRAFEEKYGSNTYDKYYDVFGVLREEELLENMKKQYKEAQERNRRYYESNRGNYNYNSNSSYQRNNQSNYSDEDKSQYKKLYKTLAKAYHPDIAKDDGEMMKLVNKLKEEWGI